MNPQKSQSGLQKALHRLLWTLVYALPAVLFFSYYPIISFGSNSSMNFELSLPLLWLVLFDLAAFLALILNRKHLKTLQRGRPVQGANRKKSLSKLSIRFSKSSRERKARATEQNTRKDGRANGMKKSWQIDLPGISDRRFFLFTLFPFYATLSIFWSANPVRAILTTGIIWLLFFAVFAIIYLLPLFSPPQSFRKHLLATFFISTALVCVFCFVQSILDACGVSREHTLLCAGCTSYSFGFPHPSGFAIEPQFMGNLLLAPTLTALYLLTFHSSNQEKRARKQTQRARTLKPDRITFPESPELTSEDEDAAHPRRRAERTSCPEKWIHRALVLFTSLFSVTLFFTLSRGAIYAYAVALLVLLIFSLTKHHFRWTLITIPVFTFLLSLGLQGAFSALGPTSETFMGGITKSIHQLSLGIIDLRGLAKPPETSQNPSDLTVPLQNSPETASSTSPEALESPSNHNLNNHGSSVSAPLETAPDAPESSIFEGYVPESTNVRLGLNRAALDTWLSAPGHPQSSIYIGLKCTDGDPCNASVPLTPTSIFFGVGLGGAGTALYQNRFITGIGSPKEIVQNQFFSLLLELGLVGFLLALFSLLLAFVPNIFPKKFLDGRTARLEPASRPKPTPINPAASVNSHSTKSPKIFQNPFFQSPALPVLSALIIAYLVSLNFFSGLPNALHIYLLPPLLFFLFAPAEKTPTNQALTETASAQQTPPAAKTAPR